MCFERGYSNLNVSILGKLVTSACFDEQQIRFCLQFFMLDDSIAVK